MAFLAKLQRWVEKGEGISLAFLAKLQRRIEKRRGDKFGNSNSKCG
ncbi:hypothetical protein IJ384_03125 [bacterium]|nr:hypothetical protein [bacterium]